MDEEPQTVLIIFLSLLLSAFFSGIEIAFVSSNKLKIELDHKQGFLSGRILHYFVRHTPYFMSALLLANNISLVFFGIYVARFLEPFLVRVSVEPVFVLVVQTLIATILVLITGEFLPKTFFSINPNRKLRVAAVPLFVIYVLLFIPTSVALGISILFLKLRGLDTSSTQRAFTRTDLDYYVKDISERTNGNGEMNNEIEILQNALEFSSVRAKDCLIPRTEIEAVNINEDIAALRQRFIETGYSKLVVYQDSIDNIIGYVHAFELFRKPASIREILLPVAIVPEALLVKELLPQFMRNKRSMAIVVDEFGGTAGLVTIEDIIEEIFGEIQDEHDTEELVEHQVGDKIWRFSGRIEIEHLNEKYHFGLEESEEYDTLAGFVIHQLEEIPEAGTVLETENFLITVLEVSEARVDLVRFETLD